LIVEGADPSVEGYPENRVIGSLRKSGIVAILLLSHGVPPWDTFLTAVSVVSLRRGFQYDSLLVGGPRFAMGTSWGTLDQNSQQLAEVAREEIEVERCAFAGWAAIPNKR